MGEIRIFFWFLAAMSSSRSDGVTQFVRPFVRTLFFLLVSLEFVVHLDVPRKFQGCFKKVSRLLQESFKGVSRKFNGCFKELSRMFQESVKDVSRVFHRSFKGVSRKFQGCFKGVSNKFQ